MLIRSYLNCNIFFWLPKEAFTDPTRDESLIFELLEYKNEVGDSGSAAWFLQDLANEQNAEGFTVIYFLLNNAHL